MWSLFVSRREIYWVCISQPCHSKPINLIQNKKLVCWLSFFKILIFSSSLKFCLDFYFKYCKKCCLIYYFISGDVLRCCLLRCTPHYHFGSGPVSSDSPDIDDLKYHFNESWCILNSKWIINGIIENHEEISIFKHANFKFVKLERICSLYWTLNSKL
jgi:hypothetical protein